MRVLNSVAGKAFLVKLIQDQKEVKMRHVISARRAFLAKGTAKAEGRA